jgi:hypothetical protein
MLAFDGDDRVLPSRPDRLALSGESASGFAAFFGAACSLALCLSLIVVAGDVRPVFHIHYNSSSATPAFLSVALFCVFAAALSGRPFSFGYFVGFYMLAVTCGYLWLSYFTPLPYDHVAARWSAVVSSVLFFLTATIPFKAGMKFPALSIVQMDALVKGLIALVLAIALCTAFTGLHFVGLFEGDFVRSELNHPTWMNYADSISLSCLIPFAFAWLTHRRAYWTAALCLVIELSFYPSTVNKTALIAPFWLIFMFLLVKVAEPRLVTILSLLLPLSTGLIAMLVDPSRPELVFRIINFRMLAIPSSGLDHYYHYFSMHPLTHFCQISLIGKLFSCALPDQLGPLMAQEYSIGNFNASLLAVEGMASVGIYLAPLAAALCGLLVSCGNLTSAGVAPSFVLLSSSVLVVMIMNVPLSVAMVTHGGIILFGLWSITPRAIEAR